MQHFLLACVGVAVVSAKDFQRPGLDLTDLNAVLKKGAEEIADGIPDEGSNSAEGEGSGDSCPPPVQCNTCFNGGLSCGDFRQKDRFDTESITCAFEDCCSCWNDDLTEIDDLSSFSNPARVSDDGDSVLVFGCGDEDPTFVRIQFAESASEAAQRKMCTAFANLMQSVNQEFRTADPGNTTSACEQETIVRIYRFELECVGDGRLRLPASAFTGIDSAGEPLSPADSLPLERLDCGVRVDVEDADEKEPNDDPSQAQPIPSPNTPIRPDSSFNIITATNDPRPSFDWYQFTLLAASNLTVETFELNEDSFDTDTQLTLYDSNLKQLAFNDDADMVGFFRRQWVSRLEINVPAGTYFLQVAGWPGVEWYALVGYRLVVSVQEYIPPTRRLQEDSITDSATTEAVDRVRSARGRLRQVDVAEPMYIPQTFAFVDEIPGRKDSVATAQRVDISDESKLLMVKGSLEESQSIDCYTFDAVKAGKLLHIKADLTSPPYAVVLVTDMEGNPCDTREATEDCCDKSNCRQRGLCQTGSVAKAMTYVERTSCFFEFLQPGKYSACVQRLANTQIANPYILAWVNMN